MKINASAAELYPFIKQAVESILDLSMTMVDPKATKHRLHKPENKDNENKQDTHAN